MNLVSMTCVRKRVVQHPPFFIELGRKSVHNCLKPMWHDSTLQLNNFSCLPHRVFGISTLDVVRSARFASEINTAIDPKSTRVTVIGGHSGVTIVPLLSQIPGQSFTEDQLRTLTQRIQYGGDEVVKAKDGAGSATLSMAHAGARFATAVLEATVAGKSGLVESTYVNLAADAEGTAAFHAKTGLDYFAQDVEFGHEGVKRILPLPIISVFEQALLDEAIPELKVNIAKGTSFITDSAKI